MSNIHKKQQVWVWWLIVVVGVILAVNLSRSLVDFLRLKGRLVTAQEQVLSLKKEQEILQDEYNYKTSPYYVEEQIREALNMGKAGETVIIIPNSSLTGTPSATSPALITTPKKEMPVWEKWLHLFL
jgi:cell division protein FtsB